MSAKNEEASQVILEGLTKRRTVALGGEIDESIISNLATHMLRFQIESNDPINLIIESGGGSIFHALRLCDLITTVFTAPIRGIALGACGSAATFVMLHCQERLSAPHAEFLIHSGTRSKISLPINQTSSVMLEQLTKDLRKMEQIARDLYVNRLTPAAWKRKRTTLMQKRTYVQKLIARGDQEFDNWISAKEALEVGLIDRIVTGKLGIF